MRPRPRAEIFTHTNVYLKIPEAQIKTLARSNGNLIYYFIIIIKIDCIHQFEKLKSVNIVYSLIIMVCMPME